MESLILFLEPSEAFDGFVRLNGGGILSCDVDRFRG